MKRILIVEDEMIAACALETEFRDRGYTVCPIAVSSETAIELAFRHRPDIVLMDISIYGKMSGVQTAKVIQETYHIPVIFISGDQSEETMKKADTVRHAGYLAKPIDIEKLVKFIKKAL